MSIDISIPVCEHEWIKYDDPDAYNDGFNSPSVVICNRCGAQKDISNGTNGYRWYDYPLMPPTILLFILYLFTVVPIMMIILFVKGIIKSKQVNRIHKE